MKTTRKGFTLIELIVVIAIIGVLAAILVPTMLGYVRKSKLSSAATTASSIYKAINSTLTELDEEGVDVSGDYKLLFTYTNKSNYNWSIATTAGETDAADTTADVTLSDGTLCGKGKLFDKKVSNFFSDINKVRAGAKAQVYGGSCVAVAAAPDKTYTGTYPTGVVTNENYKTYSNTAKLQDALTAAVTKSGATPSQSQSGN